MAESPLVCIARGSFRPARLSLICTLWLVAAALPTVAGAQARYSWELSGLAFDGGTRDFEVSSIGATYYFDRVEVGEEPYALSAFFDPAAFVSATLDRPLGSTPDIWTLNGRYLLGESRWFVGGRYSRSDRSYDPNIYATEDDAYGVVAGKYLGPRTTVEVAIDRARSEFTNRAPICAAALPCPISTRTDIASVSFVHVRQFRALTYALTGGLEQLDRQITLRDISGVPGANLPLESPTLRSYSVGTTLYPTKALGVHVGYDDNDAGFTDGTYSVGARWFFRRNVAFELALSRTKFDFLPPFDDDLEHRSFRVVGRF